MSKENTNRQKLWNLQRDQGKRVFMMRAEGQSWRNTKRHSLKALLKKGMLEEEVQTETISATGGAAGLVIKIYLEEKPRYSSIKTDKGRGGKMQNKTRRRWEVPPIHHYRGAKHITIVQKDRSTGPNH